MSEEPKPRIIPDWRDAWRFWSIRFNAIGLALAGVLLAIPFDQLLMVWGFVPSGVKSNLPTEIIVGILMTFSVASTAARFIQQRKRK